MDFGGLAVGVSRGDALSERLQTAHLCLDAASQVVAGPPLLRRYITQFRPQITSAKSTALFLRESDGAARRPSNLSADLKALVYRETGLIVHTHLFRHIAAKLYLAERPSDFETVRRLLKYRRLETTMSFYAELSNQWAHDLYDQVVLGKWGGSDV